MKMPASAITNYRSFRPFGISNSYGEAISKKDNDNKIL